MSLYGLESGALTTELLPLPKHADSQYFVRVQNHSQLTVDLFKVFHGPIVNTCIDFLHIDTHMCTE